MNRLRNIEFWCVVLLVLNLATAGFDFYLRRSAASALPFPSGQIISAKPGITAAGRPPDAGPSCHVVRYASINCGYCSPERSQSWNDLEKALTAKGCDAIIVSPFSGDFPLGDGKTTEQRLAGVSMKFVRSTSFHSTPITLLLDRDWKIVWSHVGTVDGDDVQQALRAATL
jgi:hypothetical protein